MMMKIQYIIKCCFLALLLGGLAFSCTDTELTDPANGPDVTNYGEEGMISVVLFANKPNGTFSRSNPSDNEYYINFNEEERIKSIRIILYTPYEGIAKYVRDYDLINGDPSEIVKEPPYYRTKAFKVKRGNYKLAVLVNYNNEWIFYKDNRDRQATDIAYRTQYVGHSVSELSKPLDFSKNANVSGQPDNYKARVFTMQTLAGIYDTRIHNLTYDEEGYNTYDYGFWERNAYFFMSNADGLVDVTLEQFKKTEVEAESSPISVRVERALAKLAFFLSPDFQMPPYFETHEIIPTLKKSSNGGGGPRKLNARWGVDVHNMKVYPIRKLAKIAPYKGGQMETSNTARIDRYAEDPNMETVSGSADVKNEFYRLPTDGTTEDPAFYEMFNGEYSQYLTEGLYGVVSKDEIKDDPNPDGYFHAPWIEYIPENTIRDNPGIFTDVVTNIVMEAKFQYLFKYKDMAYEYWDTWPSMGHFTYKGGVYPADMIYEWLNNIPSQREYADYITMKPIILAHWIEDFNTEEKKAELLDEFFPDDNVWNPSPGIYKEVKCYNGSHFYRLPIPHFTSTQSPGDITSYGRYGIVRNNTYLLFLEGIKGLGEPIYPDPKEVTESHNKFVSVSTYIMPWIVRTDSYDLGSETHPGGVDQ